MKIESAKKYTSQPGDVQMIKITSEGKIFHVPVDPDNRHYAEILKQVKEGTLTIKDAD